MSWSFSRATETAGRLRNRDTGEMPLVVKLGSSIVADDDGRLRSEVLEAVCEQVAELERAGERVVLVTSGAVARGMRLLELPIRPRAIDELQAASAVGQGDLFRAYESRLTARGSRAAQVLLTANEIWTRNTYLNAQRTLRRLLEWQVVPVINENDTTATDEITLGDNDFLAAQVAILLEARLLVLLTNTDGVFTADPRRDPAAALVEQVGATEDLAALQINDRPSAFGSGGMLSKTSAASMAAYSDIGAVICNGTRPGTLLAAASGEAVGTRFLPRRRVESAFKLWLRFARPPQGEIEVDAGAAEALRRRGSSLLPVGVSAVKGRFAAGQAVEVTHEGRPIGKGIAECSAADLEKVRGMRTETIAAENQDGLGLQGLINEAIHRDRFVLYQN